MQLASKDIKSLLKEADTSEIIDFIVQLSKDGSPNSLILLQQFLINKDPDTIRKDITIHSTCIALLKNDQPGIDLLYDTLGIISGHIYPTAILRTLWHTSRGIFPKSLADYIFELPEELRFELSSSQINYCKSKIKQFFIELKTNENFLHLLLGFINSNNNIFDENSKVSYDELFDLLSIGSLKISKPLIDQFDLLIKSEKLKEEEFQQFFSKNPVFLDPLASETIDKHKLGNDLITDFVIKKLNGEYIIVEIEKPQDNIFTKTNDFSANFTHALGQVMDFQEWIESNIAYARTKLPNITSPQGLLIMGRSTIFDNIQLKKFNRFKKNLVNIEILTYDEVLNNSKNLYKSIINS